MFWLLLACTVGSDGPATPDSTSAVEAQKMEAMSVKAGTLSNVARELEDQAASARSRIAAGADPTDEVARMKLLMQKIETLEAELQADNTALEERIQSTAETRK